MNSRIQKKMWLLANYDSFIMQYCPTLYNRVAGIGAFFLFQMLIVFTSVLTAHYELFPIYLTISSFIAFAVTFVFYRWMKFLNKAHHITQRIGIFIVQVFINLMLALLLSIPFCLSLFEDQVFFQLYLKTGKMKHGVLELFWLKPYALYQSCFVENEGNTILFICIAILIMIAFIFITPYYLIYKTRKSSYNLVKHNYEQNFN